MEIKKYVNCFHSDLHYFGRQYNVVLPRATKISMAIIGVLFFICLQSCPSPDVVGSTTLNLDQDVWDQTDEIDAIATVKILNVGEDEMERIQSPFLGKLLYCLVVIGKWVAELVHFLGQHLSWLCKSFHSILRGIEWFFSCMDKVC